MIVLIIAGAIVLLNLIGFAVNRLFYSKELQAIAPYGQLVDVFGSKMHVYTMGNGGRTIVLLPGYGVSLPCADFGPLMRELARENTVVCVEYFGIGFSAQTDTPRINDNYTEEIRAALSAAGCKPPYVFVPHSASGVYCEYYAAKYPEEVSAMLMLDTTSTVTVTAKNPPRIIFSIAKLQQACGLTRLSFALMPPAQKKESGYTEKEIAHYKTFSSHVLNDTMIDQSMRMLENINQVAEIPFPREIPVLKLISAQTMKKVGQEYQTKHLARLGENADSITIDSSHFIYQTRTAEICDAARVLMEKIT